MSQSQIINSVSITPIKAFSDNYIWAIQCGNNNHLALVDPGDAQVCIKYIEQHQLTLSTILITHHHADHTGGITELVDYCHTKQWPIQVFGPHNDAIPGITDKVADGDKISLTDFDLIFDILALPGHTLDHIAYHSDSLLFCGDTLFSGGCGRLFEGSAEQMFQSLTKLKQLPERTKVYCTHEYTKANLTFALAVEPSNPELIDYYNRVSNLTQANKPSLPSSLYLEKKINPFLRTDSGEIIASAQVYADKNLPTEVAVFATIRQWKDNF
ncbi:hydroxyacylglutathione hydrolase [Thalassotalea sp. G2M2-11]|uniref:hydroxyacylglutathione hydrolase n=1 Tax=Thalassotalea sp. G2M2-11 TaxID=2787627 RepID=UPI0019D26581|nr:hydroxyacylglutathione hydrolase [Thalassotalea sp. G2M2-11]